MTFLWLSGCAVHCYILKFKLRIHSFHKFATLSSPQLEHLEDIFCPNCNESLNTFLYVYGHRFTFHL